MRASRTAGVPTFICFAIWRSTITAPGFNVPEEKGILQSRNYAFSQGDRFKLRKYSDIPFSFIYRAKSHVLETMIAQKRG